LCFIVVYNYEFTNFSTVKLFLSALKMFAIEAEKLASGIQS